MTHQVVASYTTITAPAVMVPEVMVPEVMTSVAVMTTVAVMTSVAVMLPDVMARLVLSAPKSPAKSLRRRRTCCWFDRGDGSPPQTAPPTTASTLAQPLQRPLASTLAQPLRRPLASTLAQPLRRPVSSRSPEGATWMTSLIACRRSPEGATWRVRRGRRT